MISFFKCMRWKAPIVLDWRKEKKKLIVQLKHFKKLLAYRKGNQIFSILIAYVSQISNKWSKYIRRFPFIQMRQQKKMNYFVVKLLSR